MSLPHFPTPAEYAAKTQPSPSPQITSRPKPSPKPSPKPRPIEGPADGFQQSPRPQVDTGYRPPPPPMPSHMAAEPPASPWPGGRRLSNDGPPYRRGSADTVVTQQQSAELLRIFQTVDTNQKGVISERQLRKALVNGDYTAFDPDTVKLMVNMFDGDHDGCINSNEFAGLWNYLADWKRLFTRFDIDASGKISLPEFGKALHAFGYRLSPESVKFLFKTYDRRDEYVLSFDLFVQACISLRQATQTFRKYDTSRTGYITLSFEHFIAEMLKQT